MTVTKDRCDRNFDICKGSSFILFFKRELTGISMRPEFGSLHAISIIKMPI